MDIEGIYFLIQQVVEAKRSGEFLSPVFLEGQVHFVPCVVPVIEVEILLKADQIMPERP